MKKIFVFTLLMGFSLPSLAEYRYGDGGFGIHFGAAAVTHGELSKAANNTFNIGAEYISPDGWLIGVELMPSILGKETVPILDNLDDTGGDLGDGDLGDGDLGGGDTAGDAGTSGTDGGLSDILNRLGEDPTTTPPTTEGAPTDEKRTDGLFNPELSASVVNFYIGKRFESGFTFNGGLAVTFVNGLSAFEDVHDSDQNIGLTFGLGYVFDDNKLIKAQASQIKVIDETSFIVNINFGYTFQL